jgi:integrase
MRRGEILNMRWRDVSVEQCILHIPTSKNGHARTIPLSGSALVYRGLTRAAVAVR